MYGIKLEVPDKVLTYRYNVHNIKTLKSIMMQYVKMVLEHIPTIEFESLELEPIDFETDFGIVSAYEVRTVFRNKENPSEKYRYTTHIPQLKNLYYFYINGLPYLHIYSFVDRVLVMMHIGNSVAYKLSNLYQSATFYDILGKKTQKRTPAKIKVNKKWHLMHFVLAMLMDVYGYTFMDALEHVLRTMNVYDKTEIVHITDLPENIARKLKRPDYMFAKYEDRKEDVMYITLGQSGMVLKINGWQSDITDYQARLLIGLGQRAKLNYEFVSTELTDPTCNKIDFITLAYSPESKEAYRLRKDLRLFYVIFDYVTQKELGVKDAKEFFDKYILKGEILTKVPDHSFTDWRGKKLAYLALLLQPFIRQMMHIIKTYLSQGHIIVKNRTTLRVFLKAITAQYAGTQVRNPISEVALALKSTFGHNYAIKTKSYTFRKQEIINAGIVDLIPTPESDKAGVVYWLTLDIQKPIPIV